MAVNLANEMVKFLKRANYCSGHKEKLRNRNSAVC